MKKNIAVLAGGYSGEREISLKSATNIVNYIDKKIYTPYIIMIDIDKWYLQLDNQKYLINKNDFSAIIKEEKVTFHFVFFAIHGTPAEDGLLQGYFDMLKIPYSTSNVQSSSLSFNKFAYNHFISSFKIVDIANSILITDKSSISIDKITDQISLPCFVKPNEQGSSLGIAKVRTKDELMPAINKAFKHDNTVIIEDFIEGLEVTNGVFSIGNEIIVLPITEVISKNELFDFEAKYDPKLAEEITPARIPESLTKQIQETTKKIFQVSGFKGIVRIDYIIKDNVAYMLEANTIPGMTSNSFIPKQLSAANINITDIFRAIIESSENKRE